MGDFLDVSSGAEIIHENVPYLITGRLENGKILARTLKGGIPKVIEISSLKSKNGTSSSDAPRKANPSELVDEQKWKTATLRRDAIKRAFEQGEDRNVVAEEIGVHPATLYDLRKKYEVHGFNKLIPVAPNGGAGKTRLSKNQVTILDDVIKEKYLTRQMKSIAAVYKEVKRRCKAEGTPVPGRNTVYRWCHAIDQQVRDRKRRGGKVAKDKYAQTMGGYQEATRPLEIIQIDHTLMDIIIVDDETREPIGRPWLTIAIDVYSRMVYGFYISLDPPSAMSTAMCLQMAVFDKAAWLLERGVKHHWGISGLLECLHMDNGKDFHSKTLKRGCEKYDIAESFLAVVTYKKPQQPQIFR